MESSYHQDLWQAYRLLLEVLYLETGCWGIYPPAPIPVLWDVKFPALLGFTFAQTNWVTMSSGETLRQKRKKMHNMLLNRRLSAWIQPSRNCIPQLELKSELDQGTVNKKPKACRSVHSFQGSCLSVLFMSTLLLNFLK